jgi:hypothetical protein
LVQCSRHFLRHTLDVCWKVRGTDFTMAWWRTSWMTKAKIYLCLNYLTSPHNSCFKNETRVREAEEIFKIEVHDNVRKIVIVKAQVHGVVTYITPLPFLFALFFHTLPNIILVSNNHKSTISFSLYWFLYQFEPFCYQAIFTI